MIKNPFIKRIIIFLFILAMIVLIVFLAYRVLSNDNYVTYDLGENVELLENKIITDYEEYQKLIKKYKLKEDFDAKVFDTYSLIAVYQDYDKCGERKLKTINAVDFIDDEISISFQVHNQCGFCKKNTILYLITIKKYENKDAKININYDFDKEDLECGTI
jgi:hypothetical protein